MFLGWHMHPGGHWSKDYLAASLADWDLDTPGKSQMMRVSRVRELCVPDEEMGVSLSRWRTLPTALQVPSIALRRQLTPNQQSKV